MKGLALTLDGIAVGPLAIAVLVTFGDFEHVFRADELSETGYT